MRMKYCNGGDKKSCGVGWRRVNWYGCFIGVYVLWRRHRINDAGGRSGGRGTCRQMLQGEVMEKGRVDRCYRPGKRWGKCISRYCGGEERWTKSIEAARDIRK